MATTSPLTTDLTTPATPVAPVTVGAYEPEKATAADWQVAPNQTVQSQIEGIIAKDSPLMQQAETRALQQANQRGLLNSSLAVGAGQGALYDVATPIAQQDAQTFARAGEFGAGLQQQTGLANQQAVNQALAQQAQQQGNLAQISAQQQGDLARIAASGELQQKLTEFSAGAAKELAGIEATYKNLTQASSSAASIMNTTTTAIARIMEDTSLDAGAKQRAIDIYNRNAATSLQIIGSLAGDVELGQFMNAVLA